MPSPPKASFWDSPLWKAFSHFSTLYTLGQIAVSCFVTWKAQGWAVMPSAVVHPATYWLATGTVFFGTLFAAKAATALIAWSVPKLKRWRNPPLLVIVPNGGYEKATIELTHFGESATWEVRMRIVQRISGGPNPDHLTRLCWIRKDGKTSTSMALKDGEKAYVIVATPWAYQWSTGVPSMEIHSAESHPGQRLPNYGVILEMNIKAIPPLREGAIRRCFSLSRDHQDIFELLDIPCEK